MSIFLKNICQYNNCHKNFYTLADLIVHIESDHLDFGPNNIEQMEEKKPEHISMSYVLKFSGPDDPPPRYSCQTEVSNLNEAVIQELDDVGATEIVTAFNNNYLGCDFKEVKEKKCKSEHRLNKDDVSQILGNSKLFTLDHTHKKPFACTMKGCDKRYKNVNGIKYHYKNHHKMHIPTFKKSLLKQKPFLGHPKSKIEKRDVHGIPLYSYKPQMTTDLVYHNFHNMRPYEECEGLPSEYFHKFNMLPTSNVHLSSTQVPLPNNMSFNYYNLAEVNGNIEDFSRKNPNYFIPNFDKL